MNYLSYFTTALFVLSVSACEGEPAPETTPQATTAVKTELKKQAPSENPLYALRPIDDNWPHDVDEKSLSENLLTTNYYIVLDWSGSMDGMQCAEGSTKMAVAKTAVTQFAKKIPADANLALYAFDGKATSERVNLTMGNRDAFFEQINRIETGGGTPLATAIRYGYQQLTQQAAKQLGYGEYHLVVVTDGIASTAEKPQEILSTLHQQSPVVVHSIGFCLDEQHSLNQPGLTVYTAASNAEELQRGLQAVLAESVDFSPDSF
ncbi:MAG: vWA domain-containing protein [Methylococcales bacterium]|nr:vWA domain-containing protein [Methylococcales bacterium]